MRIVAWPVPDWVLYTRNSSLVWLSQLLLMITGSASIAPSPITLLPGLAVMSSAAP
jgi:hypothetical protein